MARHVPVGVLAALLLVLLNSPALAGETIDFSSSAGGTISYAGGSGGLTGTSIAIDVVIGTGTLKNSGAHRITQGVLNFTTGSLARFGEGTYAFSAGGIFTITGGVPDAGIPDGSVLLTGQLTTSSVNATSRKVYRFTGRGIDIPNPALAEYFGIASNSFTLGQVVIHVSPTKTCNPCDSTSPFAGLAFNTRVPDAPTPATEPGSLVLLGTGLIGVVTLVRRRFHRPR